MDELYHARGWTKKNHKYIRKEGDRYIYADDVRRPKKLRKLVDRNLITGKLDKGPYSSQKTWKQKAKSDTKKFFRDADAKHEKFITDTNRKTFDYLEKVDDNYYDAVDMAKKQEDPKYLKKQFDRSKKILNAELDEIGKEFTDNSLSSKMNRMRISMAKKELNSKSFDRMTTLMSKIGSRLVKARNKSYIKNLDKQRKEHKAEVVKQHQDFIARAKKNHESWRKKGLRDQLKYYQ